MALEKEEALGASAHVLKATAPIYPLLENAERPVPTVLAHDKKDTKADLMYRLNRTNDLLNELNQEKKHYETVYKKHKILFNHYILPPHMGFIDCVCLWL